jgi:hypothetical protein
MDQAKKERSQQHAAALLAEKATTEAVNDVYRELKTQNELTRQLLRAYGREPIE